MNKKKNITRKKKITKKKNIRVGIRGKRGTIWRLQRRWTQWNLILQSPRCKRRVSPKCRGRASPSRKPSLKEKPWHKSQGLWGQVWRDGSKHEREVLNGGRLTSEHEPPLHKVSHEVPFAIEVQGPPYQDVWRDRRPRRTPEILQSPSQPLWNSRSDRLSHIPPHPRRKRSRLVWTIASWLCKRLWEFDKELPNAIPCRPKV